MNEQTSRNDQGSQSDQSDRITSITREGLVLDVVDEGPLDGEPIVLLHGFPDRATGWRLVTPILNAAGYRTYALDQRGYAPGARPRRRRDYTMAHLLADTRALAESIAAQGRGRSDGKVHLVGHDWGAIPAWLMAIHHPGLVASLTAVSVPHPQAFLTAMVRSTQALKSWYMLVFQLPFVPEKLLSQPRVSARLLRGMGMNEDDLAHFRSDVVDAGALSRGLNWYRAVPLSDPRLTRGQVTVPTTMVWSDEDPALGRWGAERTERLVDASYRFVELHGVTHWIPSQAPEALAEAIIAQAGSA